MLQREIEHLLTRPVGRPPKKPIVWYESFSYRAASWDKPRRVVAKVSRVVANDDEMIVFGTDATERWIGSSAFLSAEEQMMHAFDVESLDRREETFQMHSHGGVAWFSTVFDIDISVDGELTSLTGLRTTGVVEKRDDDWVIVQSHTSVPVVGQQVEY